jgi:DNA-binding beta-propeller fold protein YncE
MDEELRRREREARERGDPSALAGALREGLRVGAVPRERLELAAHLGHEPSRVALGLPETKPPESEDDVVAFWRGLARFGREAVVRAVLPLVREAPFARIHDRFGGVRSDAWAVIEAIEAWVRAPGDETARAVSALLSRAAESEEPSAGIGAMSAAASIITNPSVEDAVLNVFGGGFYNFEETRRLLASEAVPWALGERDPVEDRVEREGRHFAADTDISRSVSFSPDGRWVLSSTHGGTVTVRDAESAQVIREFPRVRGNVFAAIFSPDGARVFAINDRAPARLLDVATGVELKTFDHPARDAAFVDGELVLTAGEDGKLVLWELASGRAVRTFEGHGRLVHHVRAIGGRAVTSGSDQAIRVWDVATGEAVSAWPQQDGVSSMALAPHGEQILLGHDHGKIRLLDVASGSEVRAFEGHAGSVYGLAFAPDGKRFASACGGRPLEVRLWDVASGTSLRVWDFQIAIPFHVAFDPSGKRFLVGDREGGIRAYRA